MTWDVVIAGGGPAGSAAALALCRRGLRVLLVERSGYDGWRPGEALPGEARAWLSEQGLWERFLADEPRPARAVLSAWGEDRLMGHALRNGRHGAGWFIDRRRFDAMLAEAVAGAGGTVLLHAAVQAVHREDETSVVHIAEGQKQRTERTKLLINATGRCSALSRSLGGQSVRYDRLVGVCGVLPGIQRELDVLLLETIEDGWWYSVPLPGERLLVALMTDADLLPGRAGWPAFWAERLGQTTLTRARAKGRAPLDGLRVRNAWSSRSIPAAGPGWVAAGDCAQSCDPLSANGILHALESGTQAAAAAARSLEGHLGALTDHANEVEQSFDSYVKVWRSYYRMEARRRSSIFWHRRCALGLDAEPITLAPTARIRTAQSALSRAAAAYAEPLLPPAEVDVLFRVCREPLTAVQVVRSYLARCPMKMPARSVLLALQRLLATGSIEIVDV